jgi:hypothetical protein
VLRIDPSLLQGTIAVAVLLGVIGLGVWIITHLRREMIEPEGADDLWAQFEEAYEAGEIDAEEYQRVRATLARNAQNQGIGGLKWPPSIVPRSHRPDPDAPRETRAPEGSSATPPPDPGKPSPPPD